MVGEPLRHIPHLVHIVIVQVLAGRHNLEMTKAHGQYLIQDMGIEPFRGKKGSRETVVH